MEEFYNQPEYTPAPDPVPEPTPVPPTEVPKKKSRALPILVLALCCSLLGGIAGAAGVTVYNEYTETEQKENENKKGGDEDSDSDSTVVYEGDRQNTAIEINKIDTSSLMTASEIYAANVNSTVGITTSITTNYFGYQSTSAASGSGFIYTADGYVITNYHVIQSANSITVTLYDGTAFEATVIGYDENNDVAVLKIDAEGLIPVVIGDSGNLNVGDDVIAIGNPLGELTFSLTKGAVSALDREVTMSDGVTMNLIQTDCAINSGNSGGALFNMYGEVIGITNAKYSGSSSSGASIDNIGFAIPFNSVRAIIDGIIEKGYFSKPYIGVSVADLSAEAKRFGLPDGAVLYIVNENGAADKAGLQANDIVTAINGEAITCADDLVAAVKAAQIGETLLFTVYRQGETIEISVTVEEQIVTQ